MFWEAEDGMDAIEVLENIPCEIVISDIRMSKMDGLMLLRRIKEVHPEMKELETWKELQDYREACLCG